MNICLQGHYNYYGVRGNSHTLYRFYQWASSCTCKWLNRRSQRWSFSWARFTRLLDFVNIAVPCIEEFGNWPTGSLVSTPFLVSRLDKESLTGKLLERARDQLARFDPQTGNSIRLRDIDLALDELRPFAKREAEEKALEDVQHWSLLYRYRNHLVHEFREPGYGMEVFAEDSGEACYHGYINDSCFYLVYPVDLFRSLAESAIAGVELYFLQHSLDPYDQMTKWEYFEVVSDRRLALRSTRTRQTAARR